MSSSDNIRKPVLDFNAIHNTLPTLSRTELDKIRKRCSLLLQTDPGKAGSGDENEDWILHGILYELKRRGLKGFNPNFKIKNTKSFHNYAERAREVRDTLENAAPGLGIVERRALGEIAAKELAAFIQTWPREVSQDSLLFHVDQIPVAIERSFPGLLENEMLGVVIRHKF